MKKNDLWANKLLCLWQFMNCSLANKHADLLGPPSLLLLFSGEVEVGCHAAATSLETLQLQRVVAPVDV